MLFVLEKKYGCGKHTLVLVRFNVAVRQHFVSETVFELKIEHHLPDAKWAKRKSHIVARQPVECPRRAHFKLSRCMFSKTFAVLGEEVEPSPDR